MISLAKNRLYPLATIWPARSNRSNLTRRKMKRRLIPKIWWNKRLKKRTPKTTVATLVMVFLVM